MATFLITVPHVTSHILPMLPTAQALVKRGHRVLVHTGQRNYDKVKATGAEFIPMPERCDIVYRLQNSSVRVPSWVPKFLRQVWYFRSEILAMIPNMFAELETIIKREQVDCLIGDYIGFGASYAAERQGIPYVTLTMSWALTFNSHAIPLFASLPLPHQMIHALVNIIFPLRPVRQQLGLPPRPKNATAEFFSVIVSDLLNLVTIHQEFIPPVPLQKNQLFIGPTAFEMPRTTDDQPFGASLEPGTVLVSHTTSPQRDSDLFWGLLESIAQMGIPVLAASGSATDIPSELPENVRLKTFVPFDEVLPYISAIITYGSTGTVARAFKFGTPMLLIPDLEGDTLFTAKRAEELGLAYHLPKSKATPKAIQAKLKALLQDHALHARVKALSLKLHSMDSPELAANAIEGILHNSQMKAAIKAPKLTRI